MTREDLANHLKTIVREASLGDKEARKKIDLIYDLYQALEPERALEEWLRIIKLEKTTLLENLEENASRIILEEIDNTLSIILSSTEGDSVVVLDRRMTEQARRPTIILEDLYDTLQSSVSLPSLLITLETISNLCFPENSRRTNLISMRGLQTIAESMINHIENVIDENPIWFTPSTNDLKVRELCDELKKNTKRYIMIQEARMNPEMDPNLIYKEMLESMLGIFKTIKSIAKIEAPFSLPPNQTQLKEMTFKSLQGEIPQEELNALNNVILENFVKIEKNGDLITVKAPNIGLIQDFIEPLHGNHYLEAHKEADQN